MSGGGDGFAWPLLLLPLLLLLGVPLAVAAAKKRNKKFASTKLMSQPSYAGDGETEAAKRRRDNDANQPVTLRNGGCNPMEPYAN